MNSRIVTLSICFILIGLGSCRSIKNLKIGLAKTVNAIDDHIDKHVISNYGTIDAYKKSDSILIRAIVQLDSFARCIHCSSYNKDISTYQTFAIELIRLHQNPNLNPEAFSKTLNDFDKARARLKARLYKYLKK